MNFWSLVQKIWEGFKQQTTNKQQTDYTTMLLHSPPTKTVRRGQKPFFLSGFYCLTFPACWDNSGLLETPPKIVGIAAGPRTLNLRMEQDGSKVALPVNVPWPYILSRKWTYGHLTMIIAAKLQYPIRKWKQINYDKKSSIQDQAELSSSICFQMRAICSFY